MSKNLIIGMGVVLVMALDYFFNIPYYKTFAIGAFIMAFDLQIIATVEAARRNYIRDMLKEIKEEGEENDSNSEREV